MSLPKPPVSLKNVFAGYYLLLWNYLAKLSALVSSPWTIVNITVLNSPHTAAAGEWVNVDSTGGDVHVVVPSALSATVVVKKTVAANNAILAADAGDIDGAPTVTLAVQWSAATTVGQGASIGAYIQA